MFRVTDKLLIPESELRISHARSSGPGGQNVNKVNTKAILHWSVVDNRSLPFEVRQRLRGQQKNRISKDGELVISSDRYRDQPRNIADCHEKLKAMVLTAATPPRRRKKTRVPRSVVRKRLDNKRRQGEKKNLRGRIERPD